VGAYSFFNKGNYISLDCWWLWGNIAVKMLGYKINGINSFENRNSDRGKIPFEKCLLFQVRVMLPHL
jgi:hypothetical protein